MRDHVHLLITPQGITLERAVQLIKGGFSKRLGQGPIWQRGFSDRHLRDLAEFNHAISYIHQNPVAEAIALLRKTIAGHRLGVAMREVGLRLTSEAKAPFLGGLICHG